MVVVMVVVVVQSEAATPPPPSCAPAATIPSEKDWNRHSTTSRSVFGARLLQEDFPN